MDEKSPLKKTLALEPADAPGGGDGAPGDAEAKRDLHITTTDEFLAKAAKEYKTGDIDQALWRRAMEQGGGDESLVIAAYLRTRATALQLQQKKEEGSEIQARGAGRSRGKSERKAASDADVQHASTKFVGVRSRSSKPNFWQIGARGRRPDWASLILVYLMVSPPRESEPARTTAVATASPASSSPPSPLEERTAGQQDRRKQCKRRSRRTRDLRDGAATQECRQMERARAQRERVDAPGSRQCDCVDGTQLRLRQAAAIQ